MGVCNCLCWPLGPTNHANQTLPLCIGTCFAGVLLALPRPRLAMCNISGCLSIKRSSGGTEVKRNWKDWTEWGPCSAACGFGSRTRLRSAIGEEGFEVEHGECKGDCSDDDENTNAIEPPEETFIPFFSSGIF